MTVKDAIENMRVIFIDTRAGTSEVTTIGTFSKDSIFRAVPMEECGTHFAGNKNGGLDMVITWYNK